MAELMDAYVDSGFVGWLAGFFPIVGGGVILGVVFMVLGWLVGLIYRLGTGRI